MSTRPAELLGLPGGTLRRGAPADVIVVDTDVPWVLDPAELKSKCKNTPFDEARLTGPRGAHHRRRPHRLRIRMTRRARLRLRLSARLDSVRHDLDAARRRSRLAQHRLGQYRRHQCAAHRAQGARRRNACLRHAQGHRRRAGRRAFCRPPSRAHCRARRLSRPSLSGLAQVQGRQGRRHLYRPAARPYLAGRADLLRALARSWLLRPAIPRWPRSLPAR